MKGHWIIVLVVSMAMAKSASAGALPLEVALTEAARSNPALKASREAARSRHEGLPLALSAWLPTIQASGSFTRNDRDSRLAADGQQDTRQWDLSYNQNLYRGGTDTAALRRAEAEVARSHAEVEDAEQRVFLRVVAAYFDVIRAGRVVVLRDTSLAAFEARVRETETQFRIGDKTRADLAQARAEREIAVADAAVARADLEVQRRQFEELVGMAPSELESAEEPAGLPDSLEGAQRIAVRDHPSVRMANYTLDAAEHAVSAVSGDLKPRLDLTGRIMKRRQSGDGFGGFADETSDKSVMLRATVPIFQAGAGGAKLRQAMRIRAQRRSDLVAARSAAVQRATAAWHELHAARERRRALHVAVEASRVALDGIRREAAVGARTTRETLDSERILVSRQVEAFSAERDVVVQAYTLLSAVGALTVRRLGLTGVPDLAREARQTRWNLQPGMLTPGRDRD